MTYLTVLPTILMQQQNSSPRFEVRRPGVYGAKLLREGSLTVVWLSHINK